MRDMTKECGKPQKIHCSSRFQMCRIAPAAGPDAAVDGGGVPRTIARNDGSSRAVGGYFSGEKVMTTEKSHASVLRSHRPCSPAKYCLPPTPAATAQTFLFCLHVATAAVAL